MARTRKHGGGVRLLPSGRWQARIETPDGKRRSKGTFDTEKQAWAAVRAAAAEVDRGSYREQRGTPLFGDFALKHVLALDVRPRSRQNYHSLLKRALLPYFDALRLDEIKVSHVQRWWTTMSVASRPVRRRQAYYLLHSTMQSAIEDELIAKNPVRIKDAGRDHTTPRPEWTMADFDCVFLHVEPEYRLPLLVLRDSAVRLGELLGLNVNDYDGRGHLAITKAADPKGQLVATKTGQHRAALLVGDGRVALERALAELPGSALPMFPGKDGRRLSSQTLRRAWRRACASAGIDDFRLHDIRHTALTETARAGASQKDIQVRGGHASIQAAMRYQHSGMDRLDEIGRLIEARRAAAHPS